MIWTVLIIAAFILAAIVVIRADGKSEIGWAVAFIAAYLLAVLLGVRL